MSLFNDIQGDSEEVLQFCSQFDGLVMDMSRFKIIFPPILIVMLFLRALHSPYSEILDQFCSWYKVLKSATIDSVVEDVRYHDGFQLVGSDKKPPGSCTPKASAANVNKKGNEWSTPFEWLASYGSKRIKTRWECAIAGKGVYPICHCVEKPWHVPTNCPLLKELNLELVNGPPSAAPSPAPAQAPTPAPSGLAPSPSPGGRVASADNPMGGGSTGSASAPSGLLAAVDEDFDSDEEFRWTGDDDGANFSPSAHKSNAPGALYPSCFHVAVEVIPPPLPSITAPSIPVACTTRCLVLPKSLHSIIDRMSLASIAPRPGRRFAVANSGPRTICSLTRLPLFHTRPFGISRFGWTTTPFSRF
jgi:hypothetical protein